MRLARLVVAAAVLLAVPGGRAWAQAAEVVAEPGASAVPGAAFAISPAAVHADLSGAMSLSGIGVGARRETPFSPATSPKVLPNLSAAAGSASAARVARGLAATTLPDASHPSPSAVAAAKAGSATRPAGIAASGEKSSVASPLYFGIGSKSEADDAHGEGRGGPLSLPSLEGAGRTAGRIVLTPGSDEGDRRRADFTLPAPKGGAIQEETPVPSGDAHAGADVGGSSGLQPRKAEDGIRLGDGNRGIIPPHPTLSPSRGEGKGEGATPSRGLWPYLAGVFAAQVANNALTVSLPLVLLHLGQSIGMVGLITTATTALDMSGTLVSGWLTRHASPETVLKASTWARGAALFVIPAMLTLGTLTVPIAVAAYAADALARGAADTARNTVPMTLVGKDKAALDGLNSKARTAFNLGAVTGPLLVGLLALKSFSNAGNWLVAGVFAVAAAAYQFLPGAKPASNDGASMTGAPSAPAPAGKTSAMRRVFADRWLRTAFLTSVLLSLAPALRALIPAAFSQTVLHSPSVAAWLVLAFGLGGTLGSLAYNRLHASLGARGWLQWGAVGAGVLAAGLISGGFFPLAAAILAFAAVNEMANLALTSSIQERIPDGAEGGVMGLLRFSANGTSMLARLAMGLAFTAVAIPAQAFWLIAAGVAVAGLAQLWASGRLLPLAVVGALVAGSAMPRPSPVHGLPGRLIVVEGLDGSGKSTQMEMLRESLESRGLKVVETSWNSSELVSDAVKAAKKAKALTPDTFALLNAADLTERMNKVVIPALQEGSIVLADRFFYTSIARDGVRGNDPRWLQNLYRPSIRPDLVFYFKLPVETAIGRVLARTQGRLGLSEDFGGDEEPAGLRLADTKGVKYYEGGLDLRLSDDPVENFKLFQTRITASYDRQAKEYGFRIVDAAKPREVQHAAILAQVELALGSLSVYRRRDPKGPARNLFDKDPAGDAENIRRNYLHPKRGVHFYFRNMLLPMQERFAQLMDLSAMPRVFLHGSPHIDNYAKTAEGAAMVDFDRSRVGPYAWDLVRLMVSISLRQKKEHGFLDPEVARQLRKGYLHGFRHPDRPFSEMRKLKDVEPGEGETSTDTYLKAGKKWARELRAHPMAVDAPEIKTLLEGYMRSRGEPRLLRDYIVEEAGQGQGSMGFREIYLVVLAPRDSKSGKDRILLNFKRVRSDPDTEWFKNPAATDGERMREAAELYAPGWELRPGTAELGGKEYYARQIPPMNAKLKKMLDQDEQRDLAYAVGTQLGRAHRLSLRDVSHEALEEHLRTHYDDLLRAGETIRAEIVEAHQRYLKNMLKRGLEPKGSESEEE